MARRARLLSLHHGVRAEFAGASLCGNETAGSIIRSDGKSLCKVFCIITYQSQNSHPQILWVTKHQQLPHYCPPKSSPTNDKHRKREENQNPLLNLRWGDRILIPLKGKEDYWPLVYRALSRFRGSTNSSTAPPRLKRRKGRGGHAGRSISVWLLWRKVVRHFTFSKLVARGIWVDHSWETMLSLSAHSLRVASGLFTGCLGSLLRNKMVLW